MGKMETLLENIKHSSGAGFLRSWSKSILLLNIKIRSHLTSPPRPARSPALSGRWVPATRFPQGPGRSSRHLGRALCSFFSVSTQFSSSTPNSAFGPIPTNRTPRRDFSEAASANDFWAARVCWPQSQVVTYVMCLSHSLTAIVPTTFPVESGMEHVVNIFSPADPSFPCLSASSLFAHWGPHERHLL